MRRQHQNHYVISAGGSKLGAHMFFRVKPFIVTENYREGSQRFHSPQ